jgi:peptide/nickel transport system substrate-binding protein
MNVRRQGLTVVTAAAALALGLSACSTGGGSGGGTDEGTPQKGGTLKIIGSGEPDHLDPLSAYLTSSSMEQRAWVRTLVNYPASKNADQAKTIVADGASEVPSEANGGISKDGKTYTFKLRDGVMWNTKPARAVVADDYIRNFKRMCNPAQPVGNIAYYSGVIKGMKQYCDAENAYFANKSNKPDAKTIAKFQNSHDISGLTAKDDKTLQIKLEAPASDFLNILAMEFAAASPKEYDNYVPDSADFRKNTISDGPYQITQYTPKKSMLMERNPAWKASADPLRKAYVDKIQFTFGQDSPDQAQQQIQAGTQDLTFDLPFPTSQIPTMKANKDKNFGIFHSGVSNPYLVFNFKSPNEKKATSNLKVRQAIEYAINKVALAKVYGGLDLNTPLHSVIAPGNIGYSNYNLYPTNGDQGDAAKCKSLLAQAGYKNGLTLKAAYRNAGNHPNIAQSYAQDLKACGITVNLIPVRQDDYYGTYLNDPKIASAGKWDISAPGWIPDWFGNNGRSVLQPTLSKAAFPPAGSNFGYYDSPAFESDISKALTSKEASTAAKYWSAADKQAMKDAAIVPFMDQKTPLYHSARTHNAIFNPRTQLFNITDVWISK